MNLLLAVVLLLAVSMLFTLLVRVKDIPAPEAVSPTLHLDQRKATIYENLRDLQFEYRLGKLSDTDYQHIRSEMAGEFATVLQEIDQIESSQDLDALIRREIAARRNRPKPAASAGGLACPSCKSMNPRANKFCAECGAKLKS